MTVGPILEKQWASQHLRDINLILHNFQRISPPHKLNEASISVPKIVMTHRAEIEIN